MHIFHYGRLLIILVILMAMLVPEWADARAGGGASVGSRGTRTYQSSPSNAQPIQRSAIPQSSSAMPANNSHPFLTGLFGGILGMGFANMLFGGGGMGGGLLPILIFGGLIYFGMKLLRARQLMGGGAANIFSMNNAASSSAVSQPLALTENDRDEFQRLLITIQQAYNEGDFSQMRAYLTPEMVHYFNEALSNDASRGVVNKIEQVQVRQINLVESWQEYNLEYASVIIQWTAIDYMARLDRQPGAPDYVASGDRITPQNAQEQWTFSRARGGHWLLSAIQQIN